MNPKIEFSKYCVPGGYGKPISISDTDASCPVFYVISKNQNWQLFEGASIARMYT